MDGLGFVQGGKLIIMGYHSSWADVIREFVR